MLRHSETWEGMISNLGDAWDQLKLRVGRGGFFEEEPACRFSRSDWRLGRGRNPGPPRWARGSQDRSALPKLRWTGWKKIGREIANLFGSDSTMWGLVAFTGALAARLKKSANPLVDTGRKHQSVTYVVEV